MSPSRLPFLSLSRRDPDEHHRVATTLELFLDLASVIAIAAAAAGLHHAISDDHAAEGIVTFAMAFFGIWWAWMNYSWFASAYDDGSTNFRLSTFLFIMGALGLAAGIDSFAAASDPTMMVASYVVMRVAMVWLWLCAARGDADHRAAALRYAAGIALAQVWWIGFALLQPMPGAAFVAVFGIGVVIELAVPFVAERGTGTTWHRHHMIERYGLLNIIVLGEALLAATLALRAAVGTDGFDGRLLHLAVQAMLITFAMWSMYFTVGGHLRDRHLGRSLVWGYGHVVVFASGAATGAGFAVVVDVLTDHAKIGLTGASLAVALPLALYMAGLWFVRDRHAGTPAARMALPAAAVAVLATPFLPLSLDLAAVIAVAAAVVRRRLGD